MGMSTVRTASLHKVSEEGVSIGSQYIQYHSEFGIPLQHTYSEKS